MLLVLRLGAVQFLLLWVSKTSFCGGYPPPPPIKKYLIYFLVFTLEWYGKIENYHMPRTPNPGGQVIMERPIFEDMGHRARAALGIDKQDN